MKTLPWLACLAVTATAFASNPKDPAIVARDWNKAIADARQPMLSPGSLGLSAPRPGTSTFQHEARPPPPRPRRSGDVVEIPSGMPGDPRMVTVVPGEMPPPGAKPWYYRGQKYWLIPIATSDGAKADGK